MTVGEANQMLDTFASVGANRHDITFLDIDGQKRGFRKDQSIGQLKNSLPMLMPGLTERKNNLIVRPLAADLVQLDDLDAEKLKPLADIAFLIVETSPGNHQAWVAVEGMDDARDFGRRLRKGIGADPTASGASRLAGCGNYKRKYEPNFPTVTIVNAAPGRSVTADYLESLGLVAPKQLWTDKVRIHESRAGRAWPDYQRCLAGAPLKQDGSGPDVSRADYLFARVAAQWGRGVKEIAARLMNLSEKAQENGETYAWRTAENAAAKCSSSSRTF